MSKGRCSKAGKSHHQTEQILKGIIGGALLGGALGGPGGMLLGAARGAAAGLFAGEVKGIVENKNTCPKPHP